MKPTLLLLLAALMISVNPSAQAGSGFAITSDVTVDTRSSAISTLSALTLSSGTLSPSFAAGTLAYTSSVVSTTPSMTMTPTVTDPTAAVKVNGTTVASGTASGTIPLLIGNNTITVLVTAQDGTSISTYTVAVTFAPDLRDSDGDGLSNYDEVNIYGTDPTKADTDGDGLSDGYEVGLGRFSIVPGNFTWAQARADAHARGGELACFPTANLWNRAMETLGANALDNYTGLWIGASDAATEGTWTWVNGESFAFSQWESGRPNTTAGNTLDYAEVSGGNGSDIGMWYDRTSTLVRDGYILEMGYNTDPLVADADGDGLNDGQEQAAGTNPFMADTDGDGLTDGQEVNLTHTNPKLADSNGNGISDALEDSDGDGLSNIDEITKYGTDPLKADTDGDGISDGAEVHYPGSFFKLVQGSFTYQQALADATAKRGRVASFPNAADYSRMAAKARQTTQGCLWIGLSDAATEGTWAWANGSATTYSRWVTGQPDGGVAENHAVIMENSMQWADAVDNYVAAGYLFERVGLDPLDPDTDGDGLSDGQEINTTHTNPLLEDTDGDGLPDGAEVNTYGSNPLMVDTDGDGISDRDEVEVYHTNPALRDSDGDGFDDLFEINTGFNPNLASSTPDAASSIRTAVEFRFNAANGVSYRIEASTDLNQWDVIEAAIIGQSGVVTRFYSTENMPTRYFRVRRN
ncbi:MAG: cadherin-like beta sandwich domain-containing protein [Verrucomicrobiota bacterium]